MAGPVFVAVVHGPSMVPALRHSDVLLVLRTARVRPGQVVVVRFASLDGLLVKRAVRPVPGGWWVTGDNPYGSDDSRAHGPAEVVGRVLLRLWPRPGAIPRAPGR